MWLDFGRFGQARHATFGSLLAIVHVIMYMYHVHVEDVEKEFENVVVCSDQCRGSKVKRIPQISARSLATSECEKLCSLLTTKQGHA